MAVDLFPPQSSSELTGPEWLRARGATAAAALSEWDLPTTDLEEWRYSRIRDLHPERFSTLGGAAEGTAEAGRVPVLPGMENVYPGTIVAQREGLATVRVGDRRIFSGSLVNSAVTLLAISRYPTPRTVCTWTGRLGSTSTFWRRRRIVTQT